MDAEILFPEISLFRLNKICSSDNQSMDPPVRKISKSRRRKICLLKMKNSMVHHSKSESDLDGTYFDLVNICYAAHSSALAGGGDGRKPSLPVDSALSLPAIESSVVNLNDTSVVLAAAQHQSSLQRYNLRPRVLRLR